MHFRTNRQPSGTPTSGSLSHKHTTHNTPHTKHKNTPAHTVVPQHHHHSMFAASGWLAGCSAMILALRAQPTQLCRRVGEGNTSNIALHIRVGPRRAVASVLLAFPHPPLTRLDAHTHSQIHQHTHTQIAQTHSPSLNIVHCLLRIRIALARTDPLLHIVIVRITTKKIKMCVNLIGIVCSALHNDAIA